VPLALLGDHGAIGGIVGISLGDVLYRFINTQVYSALPRGVLVPTERALREFFNQLLSSWLHYLWVPLKVWVKFAKFVIDSFQRVFNSGFQICFFFLETVSPNIHLRAKSWRIRLGIDFIKNLGFLWQLLFRTPTDIWVCDVHIEKLLLRLKSRQIVILIPCLRLGHLLINCVSLPHKWLLGLFLNVQVRTFLEIIWKFQFFGVLFLSTLGLVTWPLSWVLSLLTHASFEIFWSSEPNLTLHLRIEHW